MPRFSNQRREKLIALILRIVAVIAGIAQLFAGNMIIGISTLLAVAAISLPELFTRGRIKSLPIDFELIFIIMVTLQFVIGETLDFYDIVPFYDKFIHFSLPLFIGFISFMVAYTLHEIGALRITTLSLMFVIIFMTLGVGALWEIAEYLSDIFLSPTIGVQHLQGSIVESANNDTMRDLIVDLLGGIVGSILGLRYINTKSSDLRTNLVRLVREITANFKV